MKIKLYYSVLSAVFIFSGCAAEKGLVYKFDKAHSYANRGRSNHDEGKYDLAPLPRWNSVMYNTLAAAYAEAGDFDTAVKSQEKAIQFLSEKGKSDLLDDFEKRLESYKRDTPWRDTQVNITRILQ